MQLSQTAEYAVRAVVWLAENAGNPQTTQQIADGCRVPAVYLAKVLQPLVKGGVISAQRGLGGGYVLQHDPDQLTLLAVISAVEPVQRIRSCPLKISTHGSRLCAVHQALDDTLAMVEKRLGEQTIGDLLSRSTGSRPLCETTSGAVSLGMGFRPKTKAATEANPQATGLSGQGGSAMNPST